LRLVGRRGWKRDPWEEPVLFRRKRSKDEEDQAVDRAGLIGLLLGADEIERKRVLLLALQKGELRKSEVSDLLRLVDRLEGVATASEPSAPGR
jgi:hypothetical protein